MNKVRYLKLIFFISFLVVIIFVFFNFNQNNDSNFQQEKEEKIYTTNIIEGVNYSSKDANGNRYIVNAKKGEIDINQKDIIFLTGVSASIETNEKYKINIKSDFGKYNTSNFNTTFSKNLIITYLENKITADYGDFSIERNNMIISRNVNFTNSENKIIADLVEINIQTKDVVVSMYELDKKLSIKSQKNGYN